MNWLLLGGALVAGTLLLKKKAATSVDPVDPSSTTSTTSTPTTSTDLEKMLAEFEVKLAADKLAAKAKEDAAAAKKAKDALKKSEDVLEAGKDDLKKGKGYVEDKKKTPVTKGPTGEFVVLGSQTNVTCIKAVWGISYCKATLGDSGIAMFQDWTLSQRVKAGRPKGMPFKVALANRKPHQGPIAMKASDGIWDFFKYGKKYYAVLRKQQAEAPPGGGWDVTKDGAQDSGAPPGGGWDVTKDGAQDSGTKTNKSTFVSVPGIKQPPGGHSLHGCGTGGYYDCD